MRVLSSFADPFRRVTDVELGCKLTYLQDLKDPIFLVPSEDPANSELTNRDAEFMIFPSSAAYYASKCLSEIGITSVPIPLTNNFSVAEFDLSSGYVSVLSDLLVSESYCGYLDENENLNIINLADYGASGPIISSRDLIDIGPIGVGQLPGDAVFVSYSALRLRPPDNEPIRQREREENEIPDREGGQDQRQYNGEEVTTTGQQSVIVIAYDKEGESMTQTYNDAQSGTTVTTYRVFNFIDSSTGRRRPSAVVVKRIATEKRSTASVAGAAITQYLSAGFDFSGGEVSTTTTESFGYDNYGNETFRTLIKSGSRIHGLGMLGLQMVYEDPVTGNPTKIDFPEGSMILEGSDTYSTTNGDYKSSTTYRYGPWPASISGQQSIAEGRNVFKSAGAVSTYIDQALGGLYLLDISSSSTRSRGGGEQSAPLPERIISQQLSEETGNPDNEYRTESVTEIEVAIGDRSAKRRIELSMPYAPDSVFRRETISSNPIVYSYYILASDAPAKAARFGRTQNRMLLGNRSGMNIQIVPEKLPNAPFAPVYIEAAGTINLYRVNAASWTMDSSGIVASTDAMFWGTAGRTT
jgi:hypothetical protein